MIIGDKNNMNNYYFELFAIILIVGVSYIGILHITAKRFSDPGTKPHAEEMDDAAATEVLIRKSPADHRIHSAEDVFRYVHPKVHDKSIEYLLILLVTEGGRLAAEIQCTDKEGGYVRFPDTSQIIHCCREYKITTLYIAHNHPNGNVYPSAEDIHYTAQLAEKLYKEGIAIQDHIIVTNRKYYSMRKNDPYGLIIKT